MCDCCKNVENYSDKQLVINERIDFGVMGEALATVSVEGDELISYTAMVWGTDWNIKAKIKYCPMCGRKLEEVENGTDH